jgi:hypothetical protein
VEEFKYLETAYVGTSLTNQKAIQEEIKSTLKSGNCLLVYGAETFVFCFVIKNFKYNVIQKYNFACCFVWVTTWSLTLKQKLRLSMFENRMLRRIFGHKKDEVTGEWRKLYNEELKYLYPSPNIVRVIESSRMRWVVYVARMGERRHVYKVLVGKSEGKRPLGRLRRRWEDNIKVDLQEVGCEGMDWIDVVQNRDRWQALVKAIMKIRPP